MSMADIGEYNSVSIEHDTERADNRSVDVAAHGLDPSVDEPLANVTTARRSARSQRHRPPIAQLRTPRVGPAAHFRRSRIGRRAGSRPSHGLGRDALPVRPSSRSSCSAVTIAHRARGIGGRRASPWQPSPRRPRCSRRLRRSRSALADDGSWSASGCHGHSPRRSRARRHRRLAAVRVSSRAAATLRRLTTLDVTVTASTASIATRPRAGDDREHLGDDRGIGHVQRVEVPQRRDEQDHRRSRRTIEATSTVRHQLNGRARQHQHPEAHGRQHERGRGARLAAAGGRRRRTRARTR